MIDNNRFQELFEEYKSELKGVDGMMKNSSGKLSRGFKIIGI
ncbi:hypothetical protein [Holdemanella porci]|nr:hypothetical protein [Holdemanella porci]